MSNRSVSLQAFILRSMQRHIISELTSTYRWPDFRPHISRTLQEAAYYFYFTFSLTGISDSAKRVP